MVTTSESYAAGLIGDAVSSFIYNSYTRIDGNINGISNFISVVGGLVGQMNISVLRHAYVLVNGNLSSVAQLSFAGGLIGDVFRNTIIDAYYYAPNIQSNQITTEGLNRSSNQLRCPTVLVRLCDGASTYPDWDDAIWAFGTRHQWPVLRY